MFPQRVCYLNQAHFIQLTLYRATFATSPHNKTASFAWYSQDMKYVPVNYSIPGHYNILIYINFRDRFGERGLWLLIVIKGMMKPYESFVFAF